jgi:hypothetical protein
VLLGEQLDDEELQDIFNEYDTNLTGRMDFVAFIALMKGINEKESPFNNYLIFFYTLISLYLYYPIIAPLRYLHHHDVKDGRQSMALT